MNNKELKIKEILEDLYLIDSSLRDYQIELEKIIKKLLEIKPEVTINDQFKQELRRELLVQIQKMKEQQPIKLNKFMNIFSFNKLSYSLTGAVLSIIIVFVGVYYANQKGYLLINTESGLMSDFSKESLSNQAFGSLRTEEQSSGVGGAVGGGSENKQAYGTGGGGGIGVVYDNFNYRYLYKGDALDLINDKVEVLKREKSSAGAGITNLVQNMNLGIINLSNFLNAKLDSASFSQNKDFGYLIHVNFQEGFVSLNNNYQDNGWKEVLNVCFERDCPIPQQLNESDIPNEQKLIEIADNFIQDYNISLNNYGQPEARRDLLIREMNRAKSMEGGYYSPDTVRVLYPLVINNKNVYDEWGNKIGLGITINLRAMKVIGLDNLYTQNYQASLYEAETDFSKIIEFAEKGGTNQMFFGDNAKTIDVEISDPVLGYIKIWKYQQGDGEEFLVPGLIFKINGDYSNNNYSRENIVVPLAKELLQENN